ncbi:MAG: FAD-dependent oxidoreductase [Caulobacteraceae bacterium]
MKISIIGGGISGLTLGAALSGAGAHMDVEIFERAPLSADVFHGYDLVMKPEGGVKVLRELGLLEDITTTARDVRGFCYLSERGSILMQESLRPSGVLPSEGDIFGVSRGRLRETLLSRIKRAVNYNKTLKSYVASDEGVSAQFEDGTEWRGDLLVACDGVNSAVRRQMLGDQPTYLGLITIQGITSDPWPEPLIEKGTLMTLGPGSSIIVQRNYASGATHWSYTTHAPLGSLSNRGPEILKQWVADRVKRWTPPFETLVRNTPTDRIRLRSIYDREPTRNTLAGSVILIGDAAHPMSPFHGLGANMAMLDALKLSEVLAAPHETKQDLARALSDFNDEMFERTKPVVLLSRKAAQGFHARSWTARKLRNAGLRAFHRLGGFAKPSSH